MDSEEGKWGAVITMWGILILLGVGAGYMIFDLFFVKG